MSPVTQPQTVPPLERPWFTEDSLVLAQHVDGDNEGAPCLLVDTDKGYELSLGNVGPGQCRRHPRICWTTRDRHVLQDEVLSI